MLSFSSTDPTITKSTDFIKSTLSALGVMTPLIFPLFTTGAALSYMHTSPSPPILDTTPTSLRYKFKS